MNGDGGIHGARVLSVLLLSVFGVVLAGCGATKVSGTGTGTGPDLVLITIDTLRADHLGAYGARFAATPNLDALAARGLRFDEVMSTAPLTLPAHATLLTGRLPHQHGLRTNGAGILRPGIDTLASVLAGAGWHTAAFVGAFVLDHRFGLDRGFAHYDDGIARGADGGVRLESERPASAVIDAALAFMRAERETPGGRKVRRFLWLHLYDPHAPYRPPEPFASRFAGQPYDGEIAAVDAQLGRLFEAISASGRPSWVVVAGDHGEALGEHGEASHGLFLYRGVLRVPWIIAGPGVAPASVLRTPVSIADIGPTLAALAGAVLRPDPSLPRAGRDLASSLLRGVEPPADDLYAETRYPATFGWHPLAALRRGRLRVVQAPRPELYDLEADPGERRNLIRSRRRAARAMLTALAELAGSGADASEVETEPAVDAETRARLAALGYASSVRPPSGAVPDGADPKDRVAALRAWEAAHGALERGQLAEARQAFADLVAEDPSNPVFRRGLARALRRMGDTEAALALYRQAAAAAPASAEGWYELAAALRDAGRAREAQAAAEQALGRDPRRPQALNLLGIGRLAAGELDAALADFDAALAVDPRDAAAHNNRGNALRALGRLDEAAGAYRRALALAPSFADPWNGLGALAVLRDAPRDAIGLFDRALVLQDDFLQARLNRGIALELAGDREAAAAAYRAVITRSGDQRQHAAQRTAATTLLARLSAAPR